MIDRYLKLLGAKILPSLVLGAAGSAYGSTIYADNALPADCATTYHVGSRSCRGGNDAAYNTLAGALNAAQPGDIVLLRAGRFPERLIPPRSGNPQAWITITNNPGESVTLSGSEEVAIYLSGRAYLIIEGLQVTDTLGWGRIENSNNNIIRNNRFSMATAHGTTGGFKLVRSAYNKIVGNSFDDGHDNMVIQESDHNLVQNNNFTNARHSLLSVRCSSYNVFRGNRFSNVNQKAAEIYDCEAVSDAPYKLDATKRNIFENNVFAYTRGSSADYRYNGIQYGGQNGIVRRNVFYDNQGGALSFQVYSAEALRNYGHRIYNNTFYNNRCEGLNASSSNSPQYYDILVKNNIFYKNADCAGNLTQVRIGNPSAVIMSSNAILTSSPRFVNETERDLRLDPSSPMIDAGAFVARTVRRGTGTRLTVDDVSYFFDGNGIAGEVGDSIQLEGQTQAARIVSIDYVGKILTLDQALTWQDRQGVHIAYAGARPDMGAFEFQSGTGTASLPSTNPRTESR